MTGSGGPAAFYSSDSETSPCGTCLEPVDPEVTRLQQDVFCAKQQLLLFLSLSLECPHVCPLPASPRYMVDAADQEKIEASKNELHNLLDKPQLQGIPVRVTDGVGGRGRGGAGAGPSGGERKWEARRSQPGHRCPGFSSCPLFSVGPSPGQQARPPRGIG